MEKNAKQPCERERERMEGSKQGSAAMVVEEEEEEMGAPVEEGKKVAGGERRAKMEGKDGCNNDEKGVGGDGEDEEDGGARDEGEEEVKWAKYYSSGQEILLVGEGDFSFSFSLATSFRSASNIVATSLDSYRDVTWKYRKAKTHLGDLKKMGATLLHGVDATRMKLHLGLKMRKFDRIIFNFPHAGFRGKEDDIRLINLHKQLVHGFFKNASRMLRPDGEIHISHKTSFPYRNWKLEGLAFHSSLVLFKCADFKIEDYPGYNNKRGDGLRCDQPFPLGECCTFMFRIGKPPRGKPAASNVQNLCGMLSSSSGLPERNSNCVPIASDGYVPLATEGTPVAGYNGYVSGWPNVEGSPRRFLPHSRPHQPGYVTDLGERTGSPRRVIDSLLSDIFIDLKVDARKMHGSVSPEFRSAVEGFLRTSYRVYMNEAPGRTKRGYIAHLQDLHRSSILRTAWLRKMLLRQTPEVVGARRFGEPLLAASVWC